MCGIVPIPGMPLYGATRDGRIWSKKAKGPGRLRESKYWHEMMQRRRAGYWSVCLQEGESERDFTVHSLIAKTFLGDCPEGYEVNHKDGNKDDNSDGNLEYITKLENLQHAWEMGLIKVGKPKLSPNDVDMIRRYRRFGYSQREIAEIFKVYPSTISDILNSVTHRER